METGFQNMAPEIAPDRHVHFSLPDNVKIKHSVTIMRPREDIYLFWRNFQNLPLIFKSLESVDILSSTRSHWKLKLRSSLVAEWDAEITEDRENELISWSSVEGSRIQTSGTIVFEKDTHPSRSVVRLAMNYAIPGGKLSEWAALFSGEDPETLAITNLKRLKAFLETGEAPTTQGQPSGRKEH